MDIEELLTLCRTWAEREEELTPEAALTLLTEYYMEQCGVSLTMRTLAYECGSHWMYKLSLSDHTLAEKADKLSFTQLAPYLSDKFAKNKQHYWEYDISNLSEDAILGGMTEILTDEWIEDPLRIAFACGFLPYYKEYKEFERTYNAWMQSQNNNKENGYEE